MMGELLNQVIHILQRRIALNPDSIGTASIKRAIRRRSEHLNISDSLSYLELLKFDESELHSLIEEVVVSESWFYRDREGFEALRTFIMAKVAQDQKAQIRVLSLPCAHGEEPFSIAIFLEEIGISKERYKIVGADISSEALNRARSGLFHLYALRGCSEEYIQKNFIKISNTRYQIAPLIQNQVEFVQANAADDSIKSIGEFDVIFCRNLLIYMSPEDQVAVLSRLSSILSIDGIIILTAAESISALSPTLNLTSLYNSSCFKKSDHNATDRLTPVLKCKANKVSKAANCLKSKRIRKAQSKATITASNKSSIAEVEELANRGEYELAKNLCVDSLLQDNSNPELHYLLGVIRGAQGYSDLAKESYRKALYLNPHHAEAALALSLVTAEREQSNRLRSRSIRSHNRIGELI